MELKELKKGEYFTIKPFVEPKETQVWIKGEYDRATKTYSCTNFSDTNCERFLAGNKVVFTDFTF